MFLGTSIFLIILGIISSILILQSNKPKDSEITKLASEFEIEAID